VLAAHGLPLGWVQQGVRWHRHAGGGRRRRHKPSVATMARQRKEPLLPACTVAFASILVLWFCQFGNANQSSTGERLMKVLLSVASACLLCSCSSAPVMQSSINGYGYSLAPTNASDSRLHRPQFYMDEGESMPWLKAAPQTNQ
jgi:hypothetical protein